MKTALLALLALAGTGHAATIAWSAGIDNGLSLADGTELATGSLVLLGYFRDASTSTALSDAQIQSLASDLTTLNSDFVEVATASIGSGFTPALAGHFSASSIVDTGSTGFNVEGLQMYLWVLNASSLGSATQQGIFYWSISDTTTNPDSTTLAPGLRWSFSLQDPPTSTTIDLTDLTTGTSTLASGAHIIVGSFAAGLSSASGAPDFALATIAVPEPTWALLFLLGGLALLLWPRRRIARPSAAPIRPAAESRHRAK